MVKPDQKHTPVGSLLNELKAKVLRATKQEITSRKKFTINIIGSIKEGKNHMNKQTQTLGTESENRFLVNLVFKPGDPGLKLRREETQLLLAYLGEILAEIEAEESI